MPKFFLCLALLSCSAAFGTSVTPQAQCPNTPTTLSYYIANFARAGCSVGIVDYSNFSFSSPGFNGVPAPTADQVSLTPTALGFAFTYGVTVPSGASNYSNFIVQYDFDPAPAVGDAFLLLDPPKGDVVVTEQICPGGTFTSGYCFIAGTDPPPIVLTVYNPDRLTDTAPVNVSNGEINLNFSLAGDQGPASFDSLQATFDLGSSTPEPGTVSLFVIGAAFLIARFRRTPGRN